MGRVGAFKRFFSRQARKPSGWFGRLIAARIFDRGNRAMNDRMLDLLAVVPGESVLEIGFGCGNVIRALGDKVPGVSIEGVDFSDAMLDVARKRNRQLIAEGRVRLVGGDFDQMEYPPASFDAVCAANIVYFWPAPAATLARIHRTLRPGGRVVLAFVDKSRMDVMGMDMEVFNSVACSEVQELLRRAGFSKVRAHPVDEAGAMFCVTGRK